MFNYAVYKAIKARLQGVAPVFWYLGQYQRGKDNTSYKVPAIYIEMPPNNSLVFYGRKILAAKNAPIRIHYISFAPFKNHDNSVQDAALAAHATKLKEINDLLFGWNAKNVDESLLTQKLTPTGSQEMKMMDSNVVSVLTYITEMYRKT